MCLYLCTILNVYCIGIKTNVLQSSDNPLVIAHRGASGMIPEHTAHAYQLAIDQGADVIECDITITQDLVLVCIHQNWLKEITDVEEKFPERNSTTRYSCYCSLYHSTTVQTVVGSDYFDAGLMKH